MRVEIIKGLGLGGAETLLVSRLREGIRLGIERPEDVQVISTYPPQGYFRDELVALGVEVVETPGSPLLSGIELIRQLRRARPTSIVSHSPLPSAFVKFGIAAGLVQSPLIEVTHSTHHHRVIIELGRVLHRFATLNVAVSEEVSRSKAAKGFPRKVVSRGGVDYRAFAKFRDTGAPSSISDRLGIDPDSLVAVAVGNLRPLKGHRFMIEALASPPLGRWHLVICGDGGEREGLESLARSLGVSDRVHLLGRVPNAWRYLAVADAQIHYSSYEGLPVALMEGAAMGVPQLVSSIPGTREFLSLTPSAIAVESENPGALANVWSMLEVPQSVQANEYWDIRRHAREMSQYVREVERADS